MANSLWLKTGKLVVTTGGAVVECSSCPCVTGCPPCCDTPVPDRLCLHDEHGNINISEVGAACQWSFNNVTLFDCYRGTTLFTLSCSAAFGWQLFAGTGGCVTGFLVRLSAVCEPFNLVFRNPISGFDDYTIVDAAVCLSSGSSSSSSTSESSGSSSSGSSSSESSGSSSSSRSGSSSSSSGGSGGSGGNSSSGPSRPSGPSSSSSSVPSGSSSSSSSSS